MEAQEDSSVSAIKLEQDDFIITTEVRRKELVSPDSLGFKAEISEIVTGHEIPLPNIFASPVKNAPPPPAAESPVTPRAKLSMIEEYPLPTVNSPVKQEPLLSVSSEIPSSPDSPSACSNLSMPSLTPSPAKKRPLSTLRMRTLTKDHFQKKADGSRRIHCICGFTCNDGFLVQCIKCSVWQHVDCFYTNASTRPVAHRCHVCVPRYVDYENAKLIQQSKMAARARLTQLMFDSDTLSTAGGLMNQAPSRPSKRKQSLIARSTPDPRLAHTPELVGITEVEYLDSRCRRYKTAERNRYTEDLYKQLLRYHNTVTETLKRNLSAELSTKECETFITPQQTIGLVANCVLSLYDTVIEYRGEMMLKEEYLESYDPTRDGNPYVLFYSGLHSIGITVVVDSTKYGNEARFVRRCCKPNCEVKHTFGENNRLHLIIWATQKIVAGKELTIPFDFDYKECNYNVYCPCSRKNCDVRRWSHNRQYTKLYGKEGASMADEVPAKKSKTTVKTEKEIKEEKGVFIPKCSVKLEDCLKKKSSANGVDSSKNGYSEDSKEFQKNLSLPPPFLKTENSLLSKPMDIKPFGTDPVGIGPTSGPAPAGVSRLRSDAEARASLTARLQERLSPSKPGAAGTSKAGCPSSPVRSLQNNSSFKNDLGTAPGKPLSPIIHHMSPNKLQPQANRRNRRKQQFVALRNPFLDGNHSSDEEPEGLPVWNVDGLHQRR